MLYKLITLLQNFIEVDMVEPPENENSFAVYLPFTYTTVKIGSNVLITPYIYGTIDANYKVINNTQEIFSK